MTSHHWPLHLIRSGHLRSCISFLGFPHMRSQSLSCCNDVHQMFLCWRLREKEDLVHASPPSSIVLPNRCQQHLNSWNFQSTCAANHNIQPHHAAACYGIVLVDSRGPTSCIKNMPCLPLPPHVAAAVQNRRGHLKRWSFQSGWLHISCHSPYTIMYSSNMQNTVVLLLLA
jgi:hypothetical protein